MLDLEMLLLNRWCYYVQDIRKYISETKLLKARAKCAKKIKYLALQPYKSKGNTCGEMISTERKLSQLAYITM